MTPFDENNIDKYLNKGGKLMEPVNSPYVSLSTK